MPITDQVATAPCTDPIQAWGPTFEAKPSCEGNPPRSQSHYLSLFVFVVSSNSLR